MTDKILCPFCQQELNQDDPQIIECRNSSCEKTWFMYGSKELWQELITTRKALDLAVGALKSIQEYGAIAMSELQKNGLGSFQKPVSKMQDMAHLAEKQINEITKGGKDE